MAGAMLFAQVAFVALAGVLPLAARAERPARISQVQQGRSQVVEVAAHGHFVGSRKAAKDSRAGQICWGNFDEGTKVTHEGDDCGSKTHVSADGCKQYCGGRHCKSFTFTTKWGGYCYCKRQEVTAESATTHDANRFTTYYQKPCGGDTPTNPDSNKEEEDKDEEEEKEEEDSAAGKTCWGNFAEGTKVEHEGDNCGFKKGVSVDACKQYCGGKHCKSFTFTHKWGGFCYCKTQKVTSKSATTHDDNDFTTYYVKPCGGEKGSEEEDEADEDKTEDEADEETNPDEEEEASTPAPAPPPSSGEVNFQFTVAKFKPDVDCHKYGDSRSRATARLEKFGSDGVGVIGLIEMEWKVDSPPPGYWYVGAQCRNPNQPFSDPVIILFKDSEFDFIKGIGQSAKVEWSQLPYVGDGSFQSAMSSGIEGYQSATSCTASLNEGVRGFAGAVVKHKQSGQEVCVVVGTMPHGHWKVKKEDYNDAITEAGCIGKAMVFMFDQNHDGPHWDFDKRKNWGWGSDPGYHLDCNRGNRAGCTCCLQEGMDPNTKNLKYDRIAGFGPKDWGKEAVKVDDFHVEKDWVCKKKGEHKITSATVVVKHE